MPTPLPLGLPDRCQARMIQLEGQRRAKASVFVYCRPWPVFMTLSRARGGMCAGKGDNHQVGQWNRLGKDWLRGS